jgi:hypothetical protein
MPTTSRKKRTDLAAAQRQLSLDDNFESRRLVHDQIEEFGVESTAQLARSKAERRRIETAAAMLADDGSDPGFLHSALCMVSLPARKPSDDTAEWFRTNGRVSLTINSTSIRLPDGTRQFFGIPYGPRARLIMIYLQTEAVRMKSPILSMGESLSDWMRSVGIEHITGGKKGSIVQTYEQAKRLGFATFSLVWTKPDGSGYGVIPNRTIIDKMDLWKGGDPRQGMLWPSEIELTASFYDSLREHAVPFPKEAIKRIKGSPLAIDLYVFLVYRLRRLSKNALVPWEELHVHLGAEYAEVRFFKRKAIEALRLALAAYPDARVEALEGGLLLKPSRAAVPSR